MKTSKLLSVLLGIAILACFTGCAMFNHGRMHYNRTTTIGQELVDLKEALDKGAMSEEEYIVIRKEIMKGGPINLDPDVNK